MKFENILPIYWFLLDMFRLPEYNMIVLIASNVLNLLLLVGINMFKTCQAFQMSFIRSKISCIETLSLRKRDCAFDVGDFVWRRKRVLSEAAVKFSAKLAPKYILSRVRKKMSKLVYLLQNKN